MTKLFAGTPKMFGGLSNERELAKACPDEFTRHNAWSDAAMKLFYSGGDISGWKWKQPEEKRKHLACFKALIGTFDLRHEDKEAVAGWMLSEMLSAVFNVHDADNRWAREQIIEKFGPDAYETGVKPYISTGIMEMFHHKPTRILKRFAWYAAGLRMEAMHMERVIGLLSMRRAYPWTYRIDSAIRRNP